MVLEQRLQKLQQKLSEGETDSCEKEEPQTEFERLRRYLVDLLRDLELPEDFREGGTGNILSVVRIYYERRNSVLIRYDKKRQELLGKLEKDFCELFESYTGVIKYTSVLHKALNKAKSLQEHLGIEL
ncbi:hypothetical protein J4463_04620 [Candidatus Pacearchaeota archaeon]|nr:hypothetical protein [Candidatus Pacearchaeota archaeon]